MNGNKSNWTSLFTGRIFEREYDALRIHRTSGNMNQRNKNMNIVTEKNNNNNLHTEFEMNVLNTMNWICDINRSLCIYIYADVLQNRWKMRNWYFWQVTWFICSNCNESLYHFEMYSQNNILTNAFTFQQHLTIVEHGSIVWWIVYASVFMFMLMLLLLLVLLLLLLLLNRQ